MAKGTRVTQQEKEQMWQLYNQFGSYAKGAKRQRFIRYLRKGIC